MRVALAIVCFAVSAASAQPDPQPADPKPADSKPADAKSLSKFDISKVEALFDQGTKHYDLGEWDAAIAKFKQVYALMPDPSFLFNLGQAYRQKGACREATTAYKSYLRHATDDRAKVEQFIRELAPCVANEDEKARRLAPPPQLSPSHKRLRRIGLVTGGVGVLALAGSAVFGVRALQAENDLEACNLDPCTGNAAAKIDERGRSSERNALILGVAGGAAFAIGGAIFAYTKWKPEYITVAPTGGGAMVMGGGRF
jgi:hypothetical protein